MEWVRNIEICDTQNIWSKKKESPCWRHIMQSFNFILKISFLLCLLLRGENPLSSMERIVCAPALKWHSDELWQYRFVFRWRYGIVATLIDLCQTDYGAAWWTLNVYYTGRHCTVFFFSSMQFLFCTYILCSCGCCCLQSVTIFQHFHYYLWYAKVHGMSVHCWSNWNLLSITRLYLLLFALQQRMIMFVVRSFDNIWLVVFCHSRVWNRTT